MSDDAARLRKLGEEYRQQAERAKATRGCGSDDPSNDPRPRIAPEPFSSIRCWRPHTELQVGTPDAFPRLGLQATAIRRPLPRIEVSDKNDRTVGEFANASMLGLLIEVYLAKARQSIADFVATHHDISLNVILERDLGPRTKAHRDFRIARARKAVSSL